MLSHAQYHQCLAGKDGNNKAHSLPQLAALAAGTLFSCQAKNEKWCAGMSSRLPCRQCTITQVIETSSGWRCLCCWYRLYCLPFRLWLLLHVLLLLLLLWQ